METVQVNAERRYVLGKQVRFLRREGLVPANLYGHGEPSVALQMPLKDVERLLSAVEGAALVKIALNGGEPRTALLKGVQRDPIKHNILHVDFQAVALTETVRVGLPLHFVGEAPAVKALDGALLHNLTAIEVQALPADLPPYVEVDVSSLTDFNAAIHVRDLEVPPEVDVLTDAEELVAKVVPSAAAVEEAREAAAEAEAEAERAQPEAITEEREEREE